jgi:hypothetical protein
MPPIFQIIASKICRGPTCLHHTPNRTSSLFFLFSKRFLFRPSFPEGTHIFLLKNCSARTAVLREASEKEDWGIYKYQSNLVSYKKPKPGLASRLF